MNRERGIIKGWVRCPNPGHADKKASCAVFEDGGKHCYGCGHHEHPSGGGSGTGGKARPVPEPKKPRRDMGELARRIWGESRSAEGTLAGVYLAKRGINAAPKWVRFHPSLWKPDLKESLPAIVFGVTKATGEIQAVQCAWLHSDGSRDRFGVQKRTYGTLAGASFKFGGDVSDTVIVAEGPETAISASLMFGYPCECVCGVGSLAKWNPPDGVDTVIIAADNDGDIRSPATDRAMEKGCELQAANYDVSMPMPPEGYGDWNDYLLDWLASGPVLVAWDADGFNPRVKWDCALGRLIPIGSEYGVAA